MSCPGFRESRAKLEAGQAVSPSHPLWTPGSSCRGDAHVGVHLEHEALCGLFSRKVVAPSPREITPDFPARGGGVLTGLGPRGVVIPFLCREALVPATLPIF